MKHPSGYIGWYGIHKWLPDTDLDMGRGSLRGLPQYGLRRAVWDAAFGYISGFPKRDILYYLLTRSLNARLSEFVMKREGIEFVDGIALARSIPQEGNQ